MRQNGQKPRRNKAINVLVVFFALIVPIVVGVWLAYQGLRSIVWGW